MGNCCTTMFSFGFGWYFWVVLRQFKLGQVLDVPNFGVKNWGANWLQMREKTPLLHTPKCLRCLYRFWAGLWLLAVV